MAFTALRRLFSRKPEPKRKPRGMRALLVEGLALMEPSATLTYEKRDEWCRKVRAVVK